MLGVLLVLLGINLFLLLLVSSLFVLARCLRDLLGCFLGVALGLLDYLCISLEVLVLFNNLRVIDVGGVLSILVRSVGVRQLVVQLDANLVLYRLHCAPSSRGGPGAVWLAVLLGTSHVQHAEAVGSLAGVVWRNVVRSDGLASIPRQGVGSASTNLGSDLVRDAERAFSALLGALAAQVHGRGLGAVTVDGKGDGLRLGQILLQRDVLLGLVGGGDGAGRQEAIGDLVDHGAVVLPRVTYRARVQDIRLHVVGTVGGVDDWQIRVQGRGLRVGLGLGSCASQRCRECGAGDDEAGGQAGHATTNRHIELLLGR